MWAVPEEAGFYGFSGRNPRNQLYIASETELGYIGENYYIYYMDEYVDADIARLEGFNNEKSMWQIGVDTTWSFANEPWWRYTTNWRIDYQC